MVTRPSRHPGSFTEKETSATHNLRKRQRLLAATREGREDFDFPGTTANQRGPRRAPEALGLGRGGRPGFPSAEMLLLRLRRTHPSKPASEGGALLAVERGIRLPR